MKPSENPLGSEPVSSLLRRLQDATRRMDAECPLGSGALAGTTYPLDRFYTAEQLGFAAPCGNSIDGVSDRDFCIELCSAMATCMMHLSRLSEEIILWCSWEFKFIELDDAFTTGSSIMPQKKNPDVTELIRGKTGRVYGDLNTLLVMMKGIPLAYDKDMQEDKEAIFDAVDTLELCLRTVTPMLATMTPLPANMRRAAAKGFINATDCADYLTKKGMPFRDAYKCTGTMVAACIREGKTLEELGALWDSRAALTAARQAYTAQEQQLADCRENPLLQELYREEETREAAWEAARKAVEQAGGDIRVCEKQLASCAAEQGRAVTAAQQSAGAAQTFFEKYPLLEPLARERFAALS